MKIKKFFAALAIGLSMTTALSACGGASSGNTASADKKTITVQIATGTYAPDSARDHLYKNLKKSIEEAFPGRLEVTILPQNSIGGDTDRIEAVVNGSVQMMEIPDLSLDMVSNKLGWAFLPMMYSDYDDVDEHYFKGWVADGITQTLDEMGLVKLGNFDCGFRNCSNNLRPINSIEDFKGLKLRCAQLSYLVDFYTNLGALPVAMANTEVVTGIEQGTINGQDNYFSAFYNMGTLELAPHVTMMNYLYCGGSICVSKQFWGELDADEQAKLREVVYQCGQEGIKDFREQDAALLQKYIDSGEIDVTYPDEAFKADLRAAAQKVWEKESPKYDEAVMKRVFEEFGL